MNTSIQIKLLTECTDHIPALSRLWYEEISRHWVPGSSIEKAKQKLVEHLNDNSLPMAYVALQDDQAVGMACLRENDGIRPGLTPWLGSLVVHPDYRRNQLGELLIETVKSQARMLKHEILYLLAFDPAIPAWYSRLGWKEIGEDELFGHRVTVMNTLL